MHRWGIILMLLYPLRAPLPDVEHRVYLTLPEILAVAPSNGPHGPPLPTSVRTCPTGTDKVLDLPITGRFMLVQIAERP